MKSCRYSCFSYIFSFIMMTLWQMQTLLYTLMYLVQIEQKSSLHRYADSIVHPSRKVYFSIPVALLPIPLLSRCLLLEGLNLFRGDALVGLIISVDTTRCRSSSSFHYNQESPNGWRGAVSFQIYCMCSSVPAPKLMYLICHSSIMLMTALHMLYQVKTISINMAVSCF